MRFAYEDVSREIDKRTAAFQFPGVDGTYIQDNGHSDRRYPLRCIFSGPDYDREASSFEDLLLERGAGRLDHPVYGRKNVVPFGTITRRDDLVSAANQAIVEVTFWSTVGAVYPSSKSSPKHDVSLAAGRAAASLSNGFAKAMKLGTEARRASAKLSVREALRNVQAALGKVAAVTDAANSAFRDLQQEINFGLDVLIGQPLLLARSLINLVNAPARALAGILSRLQGYADLLDRMVRSSRTSDADTSIIPALVVRRSNDFHLANLVGSAAVLGSVSSVVDEATTFGAKPDALAAAEQIIAQAETLTAWNDERFADLQTIDTGESYQAIQETVALAVGFLVEISFSLVPERAIVLDRPRSIIDLAAEIYGSVDDRLDFLISTNKLTGSDIIELPRGRRIVYYV